MVRQTTKVIFFEVLGGLSLLIIAVIIIFAVRLANGPVELGFLKPRVEAALVAARKGDAITLGRLTLQWDPSNRRVEVVAYDVALFDSDGNQDGLGEEARIDLDAGALLTGRVEILSADLNGGWLLIEKTGPNLWSVGGSALPEMTGATLPSTSSDWLSEVNRASSDFSKILMRVGEQLTLESLSFDGMSIRFIDETNDTLNAIEDASSKLSKANQDWAFSFSGLGEGVGLPGQFSIELQTLANGSEFEGKLELETWDLSKLLTEYDITLFDEGEPTSFTTSLSVASNVETGLQELGLILQLEEDQSFTVFDGLLDVSSVRADLAYRPTEDRLIIQSLDLSSDKFEGLIEGDITNLITPNALHNLSLTSTDFTADLTPYFPQAWRFEDGRIEAIISDDFSIFAVERASATYGSLRFSALGELDLNVTSGEGEFPFALDLSAEAIGETDKQTVLSFWPETLGDGGRRFVRDQLETGVLNGATATLRLRPDSRAQGYLRDEDLNVNFAFRNGRVRFLADMPPVANAVGTGQLTGNSFRADISSATYDDWTLSTGRFDFPELNPRGQDFIVTAQGTGPAVSILRQLSNSRVQLQKNTGFDPERVSGLATADFRFQRRSTGQVPLEDTQLNVRASIADAGLKNIVFGQSLTDGRVDVDLTQERLLLSGFADLGPVPVQFSWRDGLVNDNRPADLSASGIISPAALNELGLFGRAYLTGDIPVDVQGQVDGNGLGDAQFALDLRGARISVNEIGWTKPAGDVARAVIKYNGQSDRNISTMRLESEDAVIDGDIELQPDGQLEKLTLRRFFVDGLSDVAGELTRKDDGAAQIRLNGAFLNLEPTLDGIGSFSSSEPTALGLALKVEAEVDQLKMRRGLDLIDATASLTLSENDILSAQASGKTRTGDALSFSYDNADGKQREFKLTTENAGFLATAFFDFDFIEGGDLTLTGELSEGGEPSFILAEITNARLVNAPFVTQILSLASLRGLSDTLSGDGVLFSNIRIPISVGGGRYVVEGARASGPALGLTMNGWIGTDGEGIELDGVLVPSFGVNSALGGVPVIGDLFVGREGEGIFSITYSVRGSLERAQVAVNPLSAVTPGILRRIFENPSDTSIPEAIPVDPDLRPPSELPELPDDELIAPTPGGG